jgi:hypothetical protein
MSTVNNDKRAKTHKIFEKNYFLPNVSHVLPEDVLVTQKIF